MTYFAVIYTGRLIIVFSSSKAACICGLRVLVCVTVGLQVLNFKQSLDVEVGEVGAGIRRVCVCARVPSCLCASSSLSKVY